MAGLGIFEKQYIWISVIKTQIHEKGTNTIRTEALHLFLSSATRSDAAPTASPFAHGSVTPQTQNPARTFSRRQRAQEEDTDMARAPTCPTSSLHRAPLPADFGTIRYYLAPASQPPARDAGLRLQTPRAHPPLHRSLPGPPTLSLLTPTPPRSPPPSFSSSSSSRSGGDAESRRAASPLRRLSPGTAAQLSAEPPRLPTGTGLRRGGG